jgi:hypothetical protein
MRAKSPIRRRVRTMDRGSQVGVGSQVVAVKKKSERKEKRKRRKQLRGINPNFRDLEKPDTITPDLTFCRVPLMVGLEAGRVLYSRGTVLAYLMMVTTLRSPCVRRPERSRKRRTQGYSRASSGPASERLKGRNEVAARRDHRFEVSLLIRLNDYYDLTLTTTGHDLAY